MKIANYVIFKKYFFLIILYCISPFFLFPDFSFAGQQDTIPRFRLVSDVELLSLIELPAMEQKAVKAALNKRDTSNALQHLADYLKKRKNPVYFFDFNHVTSRIRTFKKLYPKRIQRILASADDFIKTYGSDVDWKQPGKDLLGRTYTPNTIRFLARQPQAINIALSFFFTGDLRYLNFLREQIHDFIDDYETGKTESGKNDVFERFYAGHRTRNWLFIHQLLLASKEYDWQDQVFMLKVFLLHGARLIDTCSKFHWGNHQLHGLAGLYEMTTMYPEIPVMRHWNKEARRVILEHIKKEIKPDGFQFERASHYFKYDILNYFRIYQISRINNADLPEIYEERFHKMFDAIVSLAKPSKTLPVLQDAQDTYQQDSNDVAELNDPGEAIFMSLGAVLFNDSVYKYFGKKEFPPDFYWFLPQDSRERYGKIVSHSPQIGSVALDSSKYFVMRGGWSIDDLYMVIDGGLAKYKPDHTHGGILGVIVHAFGEEILPNYRVRYSDPSYRTMKNSYVKNVALVDNILQGQTWISNTSRTGFGIWGKLPKPVIHEWVCGQSFDYFSASHNAFDSIGVYYKRSILFFKPFCWFVIDDFQSNKYHHYRQIWQGNYEIDDQYNQVHFVGESAQLYILQADPSRMELKKRRNFWTESVEFEKRGVINYSFLTLLYPLSINSGSKPSIRLFERSNYKQVVFSIDDYKHSLYFKKKSEYKLDEIKTDAEMVAVSYKSDSLYAAFIYNGTLFNMNGISLKAEKPCTVELIRDFKGDWKISLSKGIVKEIELNKTKEPQRF